MEIKIEDIQLPLRRRFRLNIDDQQQQQILAVRPKQGTSAVLAAGAFLFLSPLDPSTVKVNALKGSDVVQLTFQDDEDQVLGQDRFNPQVFGTRWLNLSTLNACLEIGQADRPA